MPYNQLAPPENQPNPEAVFQAADEFLKCFEITVNPRKEPEEFLRALREINPRYKDGKHLDRSELTKNKSEWSEQEQRVIMQTAANMGMCPPPEGVYIPQPETPLFGNFDAVIALGGKGKSNRERPEYAVKALDEGTATFPELIVAGVRRPLDTDEKKITQDYAPTATDEYELCAEAAQTIGAEHANLTVRTFLANVPKPNTPAVLEAVLRDLEANGRLPERVAVVTNQIYRLSTMLDLGRIAKQFNITEIFVAGCPSDEATIMRRTYDTYKSEVVRTLRAAVNAIHGRDVKA